ncbi:PH domain-containing protein [Stieleria sp. TO1_6]|uniref:PH domain-containing protein n=1 Tax=Stieleria tagensis TaxID=2956795 RepID=UPI00209B13BA|nr:PH domain-containing protein [Stieleria tagensis]MCO8121863.1 PH domain-containing protein [Stieleria tagensis]
MSDDALQPAAIRHSNVHVYPSAVDWWVALLLMAGPLICAVLTGVLLQQGRPQDAWYCLLAGASTLVVTGLFTVPCRYTILPDSLTIRCGILFTRVPLNQIKSIEPSSSWISGPALSLRRVKISTASRFYLVSPIQRERFIAELETAVRTNRP